MSYHDQIEEAKDALVAADAAGDEEAARQIAARIVEFQTLQDTLDNEDVSISKSAKQFSDPAYAAVVGGIAGATANPVINAVSALVAPDEVPTKTVAPKAASAGPSDLSGTERWKQSAKEINEAKKSIVQDTNIMKRAPNFSRGPGASALKAVEEVPVSKAKMVAEMLGSGHPVNPKSLAGGAAKGAVGAAELSDAYQQLQQGNYAKAATDVGGASGIVINALAKSPKTKALGSLLQYGMPVVRGIQEFGPQGHAEGGLVDMLMGNKPKKAPVQQNVAAAPAQPNREAITALEKQAIDLWEKNPNMSSYDPRILKMYKQHIALGGNGSNVATGLTTYAKGGKVKK